MVWRTQTFITGGVVALVLIGNSDGTWFVVRSHGTTRYGPTLQAADAVGPFGWCLSEGFDGLAMAVRCWYPMVWSATFWFLDGDPKDRVAHKLFTDASSLIGGGYVLGTVSFGAVPLGGGREKLVCFLGWGVTDINVLEFVVAVLAIVSERRYLRGTVVVLRESLIWRQCRG